MANEYNIIKSGTYVGKKIKFHYNTKTNKHDGAYIFDGTNVININRLTVKKIIINNSEEATNTALGAMDIAMGTGPVFAAIDASDHKNSITIFWNDGTQSSCVVTDSACADLLKFASSYVNYETTTSEAKSNRNFNIGCAVFVVIAILVLIIYANIKY